MARREKVTVKVIGVDGSEWTISNPENNAGEQGVWLDQNHTGMITDTPVETVWQSSSGQIGSTFRGVNFAARDITFPVIILDKPDLSWQKADSRWRKAWSVWEDSTIVVISESGRRELKARLSKTIEQKLENSSGQARGAATSLMHLKAGDPLWSSQTATDPWRFDGVHWTGHVTVTNPTDMPMWPKWTITGPASLILPDFSFEMREGWDGYEHRERRIILPHLKYKWDAVVDADPTVEQFSVIGRPNMWMLLEKPFLYSVPPWTTLTQIPIAVNPLPMLPELWNRLNIPFEMPTEFLVHMAEVMTRILEPLGTDTILSWTAKDIAVRIRSALVETAEWARDIGLVGEWIAAALNALSTSALADLIGEAWGTLWGQNLNLAGAGVQLRMEHKWSRAYGLE